MKPILVHIGLIHINSFGFFLFLAVVVASFLIWKQARERGLLEEKVIDTLLLTLFGLMAGGRAVFVAFNSSIFAADWGRLLLFLKYPGFSFSGGLVVALLTAVWSAWVNKLVVWEILDIFVLGLAFANTLGLLGCFLNGCLGEKSYSPLVLAAVFLGISLVLVFINGQQKKSVRLARFQKRPGLIFITYLIFSLTSLLIAWYKQGQDVRIYGLALIGALFVFLLRYNEAFNMVKFPSSVLGQMRNYLEDRRSDLEKRLADLKKEDPFEDKTRLLDRAADDSEAQSKAGHERVAALQHQLNMALVQTRKALTKIKIGKYGVCENCGKMIDTDRLAAMPTASLCLSCEKKRER